MSFRDPKRLRLAAGSALQRRVLDETAHEEPSPELRDRMAQAIGISASAAVSSAALAKTTAVAAKAAAGASASTTSVLPWITFGVLGLALAGAIVGTQVWKMPVRPALPTASAVNAPATVPAAAVESAPAVPSPALATEPASPAPLHRPELSATPSGRRARTAIAPGDILEQTSLIDAARYAISSGTADRALALLRQYQDKYPGGVFRPEADALKIGALVKLGRSAEVRALADRFVAEYGDGLLTDHVRRIAGLAPP